jgi:hypothetical protein
MRYLIAVLLFASVAQASPIDGRWQLQSAQCSDGSAPISIDTFGGRFSVVFNNGGYDSEYTANRCSISVSGQYYDYGSQLQIYKGFQHGTCGGSGSGSVDWFDGAFYMNRNMFTMRLESIYSSNACPGSSLDLELYQIQ